MGVADNDGQGTAGNISRRSPSHNHHHHGVGDEGAARSRGCGIAAADPGLPQLCPELRVSRHLLEQPSIT
jgi:hypothetical protein